MAIAAFTAFNIGTDNISQNAIHDAFGQSDFAFNIQVEKNDTEYVASSFHSIDEEYSDILLDWFGGLDQSTNYNIIINQSIDWDHLIPRYYDSSFYEQGKLLSFEPSFFDVVDCNAMLNLTKKDSVKLLQPREIIVPSSFLDRKNLQTGDNVSVGYFTRILSNFHYIEFQNFTIIDSYSAIYADIDELLIPETEYYVSDVEMLKRSFFLTQGDLKNISSQIATFGVHRPRFNYYLRLNENQFSIHNIEDAEETIRSVENRIRVKLQSFSPLIKNTIAGRLEGVKYQFLIFKAFSSSLTIPLILFTYFITNNTSKMILNEKKREYAILQSRGASRGIIKHRDIIEASLTACIGSGIGTLSGIGLYVFFDFFFKVSNSVQISDFSIFFPLILGICLIYLAIFMPRRKIIDHVSVFRKEDREEDDQRDISSKTTALCLFIGIVTPLSSILFQSSYFAFSPIIESIVAALQPIMITLSTISNIFLTYGIISFVTKYLLRPLLGLLRRLISARGTSKNILIYYNLRRNFTKSRFLIFLLGFSLSFGFFSSVIPDKAEDINQKFIQEYVGLDVQAWGTNPWLEHSITGELSAYPFVERCYEYQEIVAYFSESFPMAQLVALNISAFIEAGLIDGLHITEPVFDQFLVDFESNPGGLLVLESYAEWAGVRVGDDVDIMFDYPGTSFTFKIIGEYQSVPGVSWNWGRQYTNFIISDSWITQFLSSMNGTKQAYSYGYLLGLHDGVEIEAAYESLLADYPNLHFWYTTDPNLLYLTQGVLLQSINIMNLEFYVMLVVLVIGLTTILYGTFRMRKKEFSILKSRGLSRTDQAKILFGEFSFLFAVALLIALISGFFNTMSMVMKLNEIISPYLTFPVDLSMKMEFFLPFFLVFAIFSATISLFIINERRRDLSKALKEF